MDIPEDIDADGVHTESFTHLHAVLPILSRYARVVYFCCLDDYRFATDKESVFTNCEIFCLCHAIWWENESHQQGKEKTCKSIHFNI